jgi:hypothetical protein
MTLRSILRSASRAVSGVGISGCPILRWYTLTPLRFAASANGTSFLMGDAGIFLPLDEIPGMILLFR